MLDSTLLTLCVNDMKITSPVDIANAFNNFFTQIGPKLASAIQAEIYYMVQNSHSFELFLTDPTEIFKIIEQLRNAAPGYDQLQIPILKSVAEIIAAPLVFFSHVF